MYHRFVYWRKIIDSVRTTRLTITLARLTIKSLIGQTAMMFYIQNALCIFNWTFADVMIPYNYCTPPISFRVTETRRMNIIISYLSLSLYSFPFPLSLSSFLLSLCALFTFKLDRLDRTSEYYYIVRVDSIAEVARTKIVFYIFFFCNAT